MPSDREGPEGVSLAIRRTRAFRELRLLALLPRPRLLCLHRVPIEPDQPEHHQANDTRGKIASIASFIPAVLYQGADGSTD